MGALTDTTRPSGSPPPPPPAAGRTTETRNRTLSRSSIIGPYRRGDEERETSFFSCLFMVWEPVIVIRNDLLLASPSESLSIHGKVYVLSVCPEKFGTRKRQRPLRRCAPGWGGEKAGQVLIRETRLHKQIE